MPVKLARAQNSRILHHQQFLAKFEKWLAKTSEYFLLKYNTVDPVVSSFHSLQQNCSKFEFSYQPFWLIWFSISLTGLSLD